MPSSRIAVRNAPQSSQPPAFALIAGENSIFLPALLARAAMCHCRRSQVRGHCVVDALLIRRLTPVFECRSLTVRGPAPS